MRQVGAAGEAAPDRSVRRRVRRRPSRERPGGTGSALRMPEVDRRRIEVSDGGTIEVVIREGAGPTIVLLHGTGMAAGVWVKQFTGVPADHRVVAWDQRGSGASTMGQGDLAIERLVDDLLSVLEAVDVRRCLLVGHSLGAMIALEAAITQRQRLAGRVSGLVLASTTGGAVPAIGSGRVKSAVYGAILAVVRRFDFSRLPGMLALGVRLSFGPERPGAEERALVRRLMSAGSGEAPEIMQLLVGYDTSGRLGSVDLPVVVTAGTRDNFMPIAHVKRLVSALPAAEFVPFERAGHLVMLERPEGFNALLERTAAACCRGTEERAGPEQRP